MTDDYLKRLRVAAETPVTHGSTGLTLAPMAVVAQADLSAAVAELEQLRKDVAKLGEHVAPVDDREPIDVNWAAEALYAYADKRGTQSQFGNQLRAVLDSRQSWRYRAFKLEDDVERLRARPEAVWLTQDDEGNFGVWRDPDHARQQIIQGWSAEYPGGYEWVNDADRTHEVLLRDGEAAGVTLWMALVADADLEARDAKGGKGR